MAKTLIIFGTSMLVVLMCLSKFTRQRPLSYHIETASPDGRFKIGLEETVVEKEIPMLNSYQLFFSLTEQDKPAITRELIGRYGGLDGSYVNQYSIHHWLERNVLSLSRLPRNAQSEYDELLVNNGTEKIITWLYIQIAKKERLMVFGVPPQATIRIYAQPQTPRESDSSWLGASCILGDGTSIPDYSKPLGSYQGGKNFSFRRSLKGPFHYKLTIKNSEIMIESQELSAIEKSS